MTLSVHRHVALIPPIVLNDLKFKGQIPRNRIDMSVWFFVSRNKIWNTILSNNGNSEWIGPKKEHLLVQATLWQPDMHRNHVKLIFNASSDSPPPPSDPTANPLILINYLWSPHFCVAAPALPPHPSPPTPAHLCLVWHTNIKVKRRHDSLLSTRICVFIHRV